MSPINWIKENKLATFLIVVLIYFFFIRTSAIKYPNNRMVSISSMPMAGISVMNETLEDTYAPYAPGSTNPNIPTSKRRIVTESSLSLHVSNVPESIQEIKEKAESLNGFMVNSSLSRPEESANGTITIRVSSQNSTEMIKYLKENSIKVVSENINGRDITDQYTDIESRLSTLQTNKTRLEGIMEEAETVNEILEVQRQLFVLQDQIDSLIGQKDYLNQTSETVKITVYLSTDEYALPYVPDTSWRPEAIFKEAVRSLILDIRGLGNRVIWIAVYSLIWGPAILIFFAAKNYLRNKNLKAKK